MLPPSPAPNSPSDLETAASDDDMVACRNCGATLHGPYCSACGQRHLDRLRASFLWRKLADRLFDAEHGLLLTLRHAVRNPGRLARRYIDGERRSFVGPLAFFLLTTTVVYLVFFVFKDEYVAFMLDLQTSMWAQMGASPDELFSADAPLAVFGIESLEDYAAFLFDLQQFFQTYVGLLIVLPAAYVQHGLIGRRSVLECGVFELYALAGGNLITAVLAPALFLTYTPALMMTGILVQVAMRAHAAGAFFERTLRARVLAPLAYLAGMIAFIALSVFLGFLFGIAYAVLLG